MFAQLRNCELARHAFWPFFSVRIRNPMELKALLFSDNVGVCSIKPATTVIHGIQVSSTIFRITQLVIHRDQKQWQKNWWEQDWKAFNNNIGRLNSAECDFVGC